MTKPPRAARRLRLRNEPRRPGAILILAMGCLFAVMLLSAALLKTLSVHTAYVRHERFRAQADWLVASGASRLEARLRSNQDYMGEVWNIAASDLGGNDSGQVVIEKLPGEAPHTFRIRATYPHEKLQHVTKTRDVPGRGT